MADGSYSVSIAEGHAYDVDVVLSSPAGLRPRDYATQEYFGITEEMREAGTDVTAQLLDALTWQINTGKLLILQPGTYFVQGQGSGGGGGILVPVEATHKDLLIDFMPGAKLVGGSSSARLDETLIDYELQFATVTRDFEERPICRINGFRADVRWQYHTGVTPNAGTGELVLGTKNRVEALRLGFEGSSNTSSFRQTVLDRFYLYAGEQWEKDSGGDQLVAFFGMGQTLVSNGYARAARDLAFYGSGSDEQLITFLNMVSERCYGSLNVKRNGNDTTFFNCKAINCVSGNSATLASGGTDGGKRIIDVGSICQGTEVPFDYIGGDISLIGAQYIDNGYAYAAGWTNGASSGVIGQRVGGVHTGGVANATGGRIEGVQRGYFQFSMAGLNPAITSGGTGYDRFRGFTIGEKTISAVQTGAANITVRATMSDIYTPFKIDGEGEVGYAHPDLLDIEVDYSGATSAPILSDDATNTRVVTFDGDTQTKSWAGLLTQKVEVAGDGSGLTTLKSLDSGGTLRTSAELVPQGLAIPRALMLKESSPPLAIASGAITVSASSHTVDTEGNIPLDTLDTINGGSDGQLLLLRQEVNSRDILIDTTGNITTPAPIRMRTGSDWVLLAYEADAAIWRVIAFPNGASARVEPRTGELVIASGAITVTGAGYYAVDTEAAAATDDLDTINGGVDGMIVTFRSASDTRDVTFKHGTGNIRCGSDRLLSDRDDLIVLRYDNTLASWLMISFADNT